MLFCNILIYMDSHEVQIVKERMPDSPETVSVNIHHSNVRTRVGYDSVGGTVIKEWKKCGTVERSTSSRRVRVEEFQ